MHNIQSNEVLRTSLPPPWARHGQWPSFQSIDYANFLRKWNVPWIYYLRSTCNASKGKAEADVKGETHPPRECRFEEMFDNQGVTDTSKQTNRSLPAQHCLRDIACLILLSDKQTKGNRPTTCNQWHKTNMELTRQNGTTLDRSLQPSRIDNVKLLLMEAKEQRFLIVVSSSVSFLHIVILKLSQIF